MSCGNWSRLVKTGWNWLKFEGTGETWPATQGLDNNSDVKAIYTMAWSCTYPIQGTFCIIWTFFGWFACSTDWGHKTRTNSDILGHGPGMVSSSCSTGGKGCIGGNQYKLNLKNQLGWRNSLNVNSATPAMTSNIPMTCLFFSSCPSHFCYAFCLFFSASSVLNNATALPRKDWTGPCGTNLLGNKSVDPWNWQKCKLNKSKFLSSIDFFLSELEPHLARRVQCQKLDAKTYPTIAPPNNAMVQQFC